MKRPLVVLVALGVLLGVGSAEAAIQVNVKNYSFELPALPSPPPGVTAAPANWNVSGGGGTWNVGSHLVAGIPFAEAIPDGSQVAYSNGGTIAQTLDVTILPNMFYTLDVAVGYRKDIDPQNYPTHPPDWSVGLYAGGGTLLASRNQDDVKVPFGYFEDVSLYFTVPGAAGYLGENLQVRLYSAGIQTNFDNVRVSAIPEPSTLAIWGLLGAGAAGLGVWRRRRRGAAGAPWTEENRQAIRRIIDRGRTNA